MIIIFILLFSIFFKPVKAYYAYEFSIEGNSINYEIEELIEENNDQINDLLIVQEKDQSLTVLFSVETKDNQAKSYYLKCLDSDRELELKENNYFFTDLNYQYLFPKYDQELIFNLNSFDCQGELFVYSKNLSLVKSNPSNEKTIINYQDLDF